MASIVLDLDGVVYLDHTPIPGVADTLAGLAADGHQLLFVTNSATRSRDDLVDAIADAGGYAPDPESVISSAMAAATLLEGVVASALVVGERGLADTLAEAGISSVAGASAEAVVVGLDRALTYDKLREATLALGRGARFVATNLDPTFPTPNGLWPGGGAIVAALQAASGVVPELAGKPAEPIRRLIRSRLANEEVWVVGDRPDTDLALGTAEGWNTALVLTGVTTDPAGVQPRPTAVLASVVDLPGVL